MNSINIKKSIALAVALGSFAVGLMTTQHPATVKADTVSEQTTQKVTNAPKLQPRFAGNDKIDNISVYTGIVELPNQYGRMFAVYDSNLNVTRFLPGGTTWMFDEVMGGKDGNAYYRVSTNEYLSSKDAKVIALA
jgi:hypothetical protein